MDKIKIGGIMQSNGRALVKIMSVPDHVSVAGTVLGAMGDQQINIELLLESFDIDDCGNFSIVIDQKDEKLERSSRNIPDIKVLRCEGLNVYDILKYRTLVLLEPSVQRIEGRLHA